MTKHLILLRVGNVMNHPIVKENPLRISMAKVGKAARGKHRWIGIVINQPSNRNHSNEIITEVLGDIDYRLFDCVSIGDQTKAIIKVKLEDYDSTRNALGDTTLLKSKVSSGKIRLVRKTLDLPKPVRKK
ncbi:MAG TPA: hypothetical protein QF525_02115 [Candidatus Thalassarchaeaceae archaeon]|nr:hypothetical protein [Candidatus Thalassarchaeaceae archaeon]